MNACGFCPSEFENGFPRTVPRRQKFPINSSKPFKLDKIPEDLLSVILTKMDQISFIRMRRTNSHFSNYVDGNRHHLKIALFHNWELRIDGEDCVFLSRASYSRTCFVVGKNFQDDSTDELRTSGVDFVEERSRYDYPRRQHNVKLFLKAVKEDKWLQKELTGVIKLNLFSIVYTEPVVEAYWMNFLMSRSIESVALKVFYGSSQLISCCVQTLRARNLHIRATGRVCLGENIKYLKELYIENTCVDLDYRLLRNLEKLEVSDPFNMPHSFDVMKILELWCKGESNLQKLWYSTARRASKIPLHYLNGEKMDKFYPERLVASTGPLYKMALIAFGADIKMSRRDPPESYTFINQSSKERAACLYYGDHLLFKQTEMHRKRSFHIN